jgi:hypothetical protein
MNALRSLEHSSEPSGYKIPAAKLSRADAFNATRGETGRGSIGKALTSFKEKFLSLSLSLSLSLRG